MKQTKKQEASELKNGFATRSRGVERRVAELERERVQLAGALRSLYQLLEEYGPAWYTKDHHERAELALRLLADAESTPSNGISPQFSTALSS